MKKTLYIAAVALLSVTAACSLEEPLVENAKGKVQFTFSGETINTPATKIAVGEKDGNKWPVVWSEGDKIGIISVGSETFPNVYANLNKSDAGKTEGIFILENETDITEQTPIVIYYPYSTLTSYSENLLNSYVPTEQKQAKPNDTQHISKYAFAYDTKTIEPAQVDGDATYQPPVSFALNHGTAYLRLVISSSEFASLKLMGASIYSEGTAFTGDITVNVNTGAATIKDGKSSAVVTVENPEVLSKTQELWLTVLPQDLTGKDVYVSVAMSDGTKNVTIPRKVNIGEIKANAVNTLVIDNVATSDNTFAWYKTAETRYLAEAYAYGETNMYMVKAGKDSPAEFTADLKARGYFVGCEEPAYVKIIYGCDLNGTNYPLSVNGKRNNATAEDYEEFVPVNSDYTVTIKATGTGYFGYSAKLGICNANKEYIWGFMVWVLDPADDIVEENFKCGEVVMDRVLGDSYRRYYELAKGEAKPYDNWHNCGLYYQWGRTCGYSWGSHTMPTEARVLTDVTEIKTVARNPEKFYMYGASGEVKNAGWDWFLGAHKGVRSDRKDDLWGNPNTSDQAGSPLHGTKSVFDPCPKGWMVCSPAVIKEVLEGKEQDLIQCFNAKNELKGQYIVYKLGTTESLWHYGALKFGNSAGNGRQFEDIGVWSNSPVGNENGNDMLSFSLNNRALGGVPANWVTASRRADAYNVRCMKDTENR